MYLSKKVFDTKFTEIIRYLKVVLNNYLVDDMYFSDFLSKYLSLTE